MVSGPFGGQAVGMLASVLRAPDGLRSWLPHGAALTEEDWQWRHSAVCLLVAAHLPVLLVWAALVDHLSGAWHAAPPLAVLLVGALLPRLPRSLRSLSASLGLLTCSAAVVHLGERTEAHFHFFVAVAVIALYQDWAVYVLAIGFVLLHHGVLAFAESPVHVESPGWAAVHAIAIGAESAVLVLFWRAHEVSRAAADRARVAADSARTALAVGQDSVQARLQDAERMRYDLIGTVSHEFRTPLTGIKAAALTLLKRGERLPPERSREMLEAILAQQERLSRLLENMLLAANATEVDETACTDVEDVAMEVAAARSPSTPVSVVVEPGLTAFIDRTALAHVLTNLVDNALHHGAPGSEPLVAGGHDGDGVWLTVSNEGRVLDLTRKDELFAPFTQAESGVTRSREGLGVGLFVVKRLVEVYGGSVDVDSHSGWVTVEVRLRPGGSARTPPAARRPPLLPVG
jgi:signal transduction histidine kinase